MPNADVTQEAPNLDPATALLLRIDLPKPLTAAQVDSYLKNGFLVVEDAINAEEVAEILEDIVKLVRGGYETPTVQSAPASLTDAEVMQSFSGIMQPHYISPVIMRYVKHERICGMLSQLVGAHIPQWDGSVKCMQSMTFVKPPGLPGQAWHQDELYIPTRDRSLCGAWVALDDATIENGCLYVIPGSHTMGYLYPQREHGRPGVWDWAPESYGFDASAAIPVEVKAGNVIFFHGYLLHGSFMNKSEIYRRAMVNHYMNAWSLLSWMGSEDCRQVVHVAGVDAYVWKGYAPLLADQVWVRPLKPLEPAA